MKVLRDARLILEKDLRIERRSRVASMQVLPFAVAVLVLFAFALDGNSERLSELAGGLYWVAVLFASVLMIQRAFAIENVDGTAEALRLSGLAPQGIFLGKVAALCVQLLTLEVLLGIGIVLFYEAELDGPLLLVATAVAATVGIAAAGSLYGVLASGLRVRETILPMLLLPVLAPLLIGATRAFGSALGDVAVNGWSWFAVLSAIALIYLTAGFLAFGALLEDA